MGDLFAQACLDANGVSRGEAFGTKLDGTCEADRPTEEKKNKKWKPTCDSENFPAYHPLMKPKDYWACWDASWVVKVDADAVLVPSRLVSYLSSKLVPANGIYLENCKCAASSED